jgi:hypothetical protein
MLSDDEKWDFPVWNGTKGYGSAHSILTRDGWRVEDRGWATLLYPHFPMRGVLLCHRNAFLSPKA